MRALRSLLLLLLVLPAVQPAAYDGEEDSGQNAEFSVDRANEGGRPTTSRPNTSLKGDYDHEYSNERPGSSRSAEATTAAPSPAARTTPTSSASYEVNLDSSESSTQFPAWVGRSSEERRAKGGGGGSNKQATSTPSPSYDDTPASSPLPKVHSKQQQSLSFAPYDVPRGSAAAKEARARFSKRPPASARMNSIGQQHQRPASSHSQAAGYPQRAAVSSAAPSLRHAAGRTSALPSLRRQQPTAALPQPAAQHSQGRYQFAKMNGEPPPQTAGYAPARRQGPSAYSWAKMSPSTRQQPGGMRGGYQTKPPLLVLLLLLTAPHHPFINNRGDTLDPAEEVRSRRGLNPTRCHDRKPCKLTGRRLTTRNTLSTLFVLSLLPEVNTRLVRIPPPTNNELKRPPVRKLVLSSSPAHNS
ncbi:hypothetical protein M3Y99_01013200 [Aphelenchoides fujianensis]|nr:hypothetical protein M3Y99_01013200 [Aphelenchoides fujianensis]